MVVEVVNGFFAVEAAALADFVGGVDFLGFVEPLEFLEESADPAETDAVVGTEVTDTFAFAASGVDAEDSPSGEAVDGGVFGVMEVVSSTVVGAPAGVDVVASGAGAVVVTSFPELASRVDCCFVAISVPESKSAKTTAAAVAAIIPPRWSLVEDVAGSVITGAVTDVSLHASVTRCRVMVGTGGMAARKRGDSSLMRMTTPRQCAQFTRCNSVAAIPSVSSDRST